MSFKNYEESNYKFNLDLINHLVLGACFISWVKWTIPTN